MSGTNPLPSGYAVIIPPLAAGTLAPGSSGAQGTPGQGASNARPLRGPPASFTRQPYLGGAPVVSAATGFGPGAGAMIRNQGSDADQSQGLIAAKVGLAPSGTGTVVIVFASAPPAMFYAADWATITAAGTTTQTLTWTATRSLIPGEVLLIAYQWAVST